GRIQLYSPARSVKKKCTTLGRGRIKASCRSGHSVNRGTPHGSAGWVSRMATQLSLSPSLRPRERPRKEIEMQHVPFSCHTAETALKVSFGEWEKLPRL